MSAHVEDRLSAFVDGALSAEARAEVEAHLRDCAPCSAARRELEQLDALARKLPADPPAGYFEALPRRVRARIEARRRPAPFALPVWAWAAAAALVLGVLAPATLRESPWVGSLEPMADVAPAPAAQAPPKEEPVAAPAEAPPVAEVLEERLARAAKSAADSLQYQAPPATTVGTAENRQPPGLAADTAAKGPGDAEGTVATPAAERSLGEAGSGFAAAPQAAPEPAPQVLDEVSAPSAKRAHPEATVHQDGADTPPTATEVRAEREALRRRLGAPEHSAFETAREARAPTTPSDRDALAVRIIELSLRAWQLEENPDDLAQFRADAAAYLERRDARRADHVRQLLASVGATR